MATSEPILCIASNRDSVFLATLLSERPSGGPPMVHLYQSQRYPTSLASIQWTSLGGVLVNAGAVANSLPLDPNGYWCAVDDSGAFVILSGVKDMSTWSPNINVGMITGILYDPSSSSGTNTVGGPGGPSGSFVQVGTNGYHPCVADATVCSGFLFALQGATLGAPGNLVFAAYNTSGFSFEVFDRAVDKFTTAVVAPVSPAVR